MRYEQMKEKSYTLMGTQRFCEAFELVFYDLDIRSSFIESDSIEDNLNRFQQIKNDNDSCVLIIGNMEVEGYTQLCTEKSLELDKDYMFAFEIIKTIINEQMFVKGIHTLVNGKKIIGYGDYKNISLFMEENPTIHIEVMINNMESMCQVIKDMQKDDINIFIIPVTNKDDCYTEILNKSGLVMPVDFMYAEDINDIKNRMLRYFYGIVHNDVVTSKTCRQPADATYIMFNGSIRPCCLLGISPGDVTNLSYDEYMNHFERRLFYASLLNGTYMFCSNCEFLQNVNVQSKTISNLFITDMNFLDRKKLMNEPSKSLRVGYDATCNIRCKTCRRGWYTTESDREPFFDNIHKIVTTDWLNRFDDLTVGIHGDTFYSKYYRDLVMKYEGNNLTIQTNGILMNKVVWKHIIKKYIGKSIILSISIDATTSETYRNVRNGDFKTLYTNLKMVGESRRNNEFQRLQLNFLVLKENFKEMIDFVKLGKSINADLIYFQILRKGVLTKDEFEDLNILNPTHPDYPELEEIIKDPIFKDEAVTLAWVDEV